MYIQSLNYYNTSNNAVLDCIIIIYNKHTCRTHVYSRHDLANLDGEGGVTENHQETDQVGGRGMYTHLY